MIFALNGQRGHSTEIPNQAQDKIARIVRSGWEAVHAVPCMQPRARGSHESTHKAHITAYMHSESRTS